ncbi:hypothetical protein COV12_01810 [Candidatus Woesearchaeota archaeon CG10_big_fil_rev_8_21_14_0_10_32_24]|nr:MAG: hypothetical protein COV12_01810 [Candidatus Woesearchaeota archaeon CG10_big_fil_rev_8_21_14_0_10_32_24]
MVLGVVIKFIKFLVGSLHKNAVLHHKEELISKREQRSVLNEEIDTRKEAKIIQKLGKSDDELRIIEARVKRESEEFGALIQKSLDDQNPELLVNASADLKLILNDFNTLVKQWTYSYHEINEGLKELAEVKKVASKMRKQIQQENKIMTRDIRLLNKSKKQGGLLDQEKKLAIIVQHQKINAEILTGIGESEKLVDWIINTWKNEPKKINQLLQLAKKIDETLKHKFENWKVVLDITHEIQAFIARTNAYLKELDVFVEMMEKEEVQAEALNKTQFHRFAEKDKLDKMYDQLLINEEIAEQKGAKAQPKAA